MGDDTILSFELGLYLHGTDTDEVVCKATPAPSWIFARTGSDGEHLSVLTSPEHLGLVVLTCPMAFDHENLIVGQTFGEFLTIMATTGISVLTEFCYRGGLSDASSIRWDPGKLHRVLVDQLGLEEPGDVIGRLVELQAAYLQTATSHPQPGSTSSQLDGFTG